MPAGALRSAVVSCSALRLNASALGSWAKPLLVRNMIGNSIALILRAITARQRRFIAQLSIRMTSSEFLAGPRTNLCEISQGSFVACDCAEA
jgi:hypothetical protein